MGKTSVKIVVEKNRKSWNAQDQLDERLRRDNITCTNKYDIIKFTNKSLDYECFNKSTCFLQIPDFLTNLMSPRFNHEVLHGYLISKGM